MYRFITVQQHGLKMKKLISILLLTALLVSCESHNEYGACIGLIDKGKPDKEYELSALNTVFAIVFVETVVVPVLVVAFETKCPVN